MKRIIASLVAVLLFVSSASLGAQSTSIDYWMKYTSKLPIGSTVRVRTTDGKRVTAVLAIVDETGITLEQKTRVPEPPRHIPYTELAQVEVKQNGTSGAKAAAIGVAAGVGTFFAILAIAASVWSD